jgi:hypothetical protein
MAKTQAPPRETKAQILERAEREKVKFLRLQFTDIRHDQERRNPRPHQRSARRQTRSMIVDRGLVRIEESDIPASGLATFRVFPWLAPARTSPA